MRSRAIRLIVWKEVQHPARIGMSDHADALNARYENNQETSLMARALTPGLPCSAIPL